MRKLDALWEYQTAELKKEAYERETRNTPARARLTKLHGYLTERQNTISRLQDEIRQKNVAFSRLSEQAQRLFKSVELERSELEQMQSDDECTADEMTECRESYEKIVIELSGVTKELEELVKWLESAAAEYKSTRAQAGKAKKEYDQICAVCEEELTKSEEGRKAQEAEVAAKLKKVDPAMLEIYKRVKRNHSAPMARVENNQCGGCNMSLPMVVVKKVMSSERPVECDNCGRILYMD